MLVEAKRKQDQHEESKEEQERSSVITWEREMTLGKWEASVTLSIVLFPSFPPKPSAVFQVPRKNSSYGLLSDSLCTKQCTKILMLTSPKEN